MRKAYSINQFFSIEATPKPLDEILKKYPSSPEFAQELQAHQRRIFEVIQADPELLEDVYTYMIVRAMHFDVCESDRDGYLTDYYEKDNVDEASLSNVLKDYIHLFSQEDQEFIRKNAEDFNYIAEELIDCFPVTIGPYHVVRHDHDMPHHWKL